MKYSYTTRELLDEAKPKWATAAAIAGILAAGASAYSASRQAAAQRKAKGLAANAGQTAGGGAGGYTPSAKAFDTPLESGVDDKTRIKSLLGDQPPQDQFSLNLQPSMLDTKSDAPQPGQSMAMFQGTEMQPQQPPPQQPQPQQPPPDQAQQNPYGQYASLASSAAQLGMMLNGHGDGQPSPLPHATMGPYTPTAYDLLKRRTGGF